MNYGTGYIEALLHGVYSGSITEENLPEDLYYAIADYLKKGLYEGYGISFKDLARQVEKGEGVFSSVDVQLMEELRENIYMFSGAKTYQQVTDMRDLLTGDDKVSSWPEFRDAARGIYDQYNDTWLRTEYDTAIGQGMMGARWMEIEKNKELFPILRYNATEDEATCEICGPLNGLTAEVDDPVWDEIYPENHFRCRCTVDQLDKYEEVNLTGDDDKKLILSQVTEEMQDIFKMNAGKDRVVFSDDHPYFEVKRKDRENARNNFGLPIPQEDE